MTRPAPSGLPGESYTFDRVGNRKDSALPAQWTYDGNNRITQGGSLTYTFDTDGSWATRSDGATFTHDARSRLVQYVKGGTTASYAHDPYGRRIRKTVNGTAKWFLWDGDQLLAEYDGAGSRTKRYGYLPDSYAALQVQDGNGTYYVQTDSLQAPRLLTNSSGQVVWQARYQAFGLATVNADVDGNSVAVELNARFPGQYYDAESGLHYNYFRDYDPGTGRYVQADPIGMGGGINAYLYASGAPVTYIDYNGLICLPIPSSQDAIDAMVGFGDGAYAGVTMGAGSMPLIREAIGIEGNVDKESRAYQASKKLGAGIGAAASAGAAGKKLLDLARSNSKAAAAFVLVLKLLSKIEHDVPSSGGATPRPPQRPPVTQPIPGRSAPPAPPPPKPQL